MKLDIVRLWVVIKNYTNLPSTSISIQRINHMPTNSLIKYRTRGTTITGTHRRIQSLLGVCRANQQMVGVLGRMVVREVQQGNGRIQDMRNNAMSQLRLNKSMVMVCRTPR